jgi:hypothetical protein
MSLKGESIVLLESVDVVLCLQNPPQSLLIWEIFGAGLLMPEHRFMGKLLFWVVPARNSSKRDDCYGKQRCSESRQMCEPTSF